MLLACLLFPLTVFADAAPERPAIDTAVPDPESTELIVEGKVLIRKIELRGEALFPEYGITDAFISRRLKRFTAARSEWMSVSDMHRMADDLTLAYHEKGLTFNQVFVLPQEISNQTLTLNVLAGRLAEINVINNQRYDRTLISAPFMHLLGRVVHEPDVKLAMERVNRLPGLKVFGFYSVGRRQGETRLNLRVMSEKAHDTVAAIDNWGISDTGTHRVTLYHAINNVTGHADLLQGQVLTTDESGNLYGGIHYQYPWSTTRNVGIALSHNEFEIAGDFAQFGLTGQLDAAELWAESRLVEELNAVATARLHIASKEATTDSELFEAVFEDRVRYHAIEPSLHLSVLTPELQISQGLRASVMAGDVTSGGNDHIDDVFYAVKIQYEVQHLWMRELLRDQLSSIRLFLYYSENVLPDAERPVLTGALAVRGYEPALFSADQSLHLTFEHRFGTRALSAGMQLQPFVFVDAVRAEQNTPAGDHARFVAAGAGAELEWRKTLHAGLTLGMPLDEGSSLTLPENDFDPVAFAYLKLHF